MKKVISVLCVALLSSVMVFAQNPKKKEHGNKEDWREKVRSEQVAFITTELNLTEAEAQAFWPVYNDVQKNRREAFMAVHEAFKALQEGLEGDNVAQLLDQYLKAKKASEDIEAGMAARYKAVLPVAKVAKLILAEEKFRQQQIGRLGGGRGPGQGGPGRPGGPGEGFSPRGNFQGR